MDGAGAPRSLSLRVMRRVGRVLGALAEPLLGRADSLPATLLERYPELGGARWRRGGLPPRIGGWCLGRASVAGITLGHTVWLAEGVPHAPELLLHELRHVHQFQSDRAFPIRYLWRSVRYGYTDNPYESDARDYAAHRAGDIPPTV